MTEGCAAAPLGVFPRPVATCLPSSALAPPLGLGLLLLSQANFAGVTGCWVEHEL